MPNLETFINETMLSDLSICDGDEEWDPESMGNGVWDSGENFIDLNDYDKKIIRNS